MDEKEEIFTHIDHTVLKAFTTWKDIERLCEEAITYKMASVCIPPSYVSRVHQTYGDRINICTVIGFPLGYNTTETKVFEAKNAIDNGAEEIDMVINIGDVKNNQFDKVAEEISLLRKATEGKILKVIVENCYLSDEEKIKLCKIVTEKKADFIKTSTGFGTGGATHADIVLFSKNIGPDVRMKAAGGIRSKEDLFQFLSEGCERIGTSSAISMLKER